MTRRIRILHISDLHERAPFAGMPASRAAVLDLDAQERGLVLGDAFAQVVSEIRQKSPIDLVCFTGDVADWGHPDEYRAATRRLKKLLDNIDVPASRFFAVPGNHDVQRKINAKAWTSLRGWHAKTHNTRDLGRWFRDAMGLPAGAKASWKDDVLERTTAFWDWLEEFSGNPVRPKPPRRLGYRYVIPPNTIAGVEIAIHIIGLDSAWLCGDEHDQGKIVVTDSQVLAHTRDGEDTLSGVRICLIHHPLDHLSDHHDVRKMLAVNGVDLVLHGHQHSPVAQTQGDPDVSIRVVAAGCLMEGDLGKDWPNEFQLIELDLENGDGTIEFKKWSSQGRFWAPGSDIYKSAPNGVVRLEAMQGNFEAVQDNPSASPASTPAGISASSNALVSVPPVLTISMEPTVFFDDRIYKAFPGRRGLTWINDENDAVAGLQRLLHDPLRFDNSVGHGVQTDPIWWWRGGSGMPIDRCAELGPGQVLLNDEELAVQRIAVFRSRAYWQSFVYVEVAAQPPTGVYGYSVADLQRMTETFGYAEERYAIFEDRLITSECYDDGHAEIDGAVVNVRGAEPRIRKLSRYNFIIASKFSPANAAPFERGSSRIFSQGLSAEDTAQMLVELMERQRRHEFDL